MLFFFIFNLARFFVPSLLGCSLSFRFRLELLKLEIVFFRVSFSFEVCLLNGGVYFILSLGTISGTWSSVFAFLSLNFLLVLDIDVMLSNSLAVCWFFL